MTLAQRVQVRRSNSARVKRQKNFGVSSPGLCCREIGATRR